MCAAHQKEGSMKLKSLLCGLAVGSMILAASCAVNAATLTTNDGVLSIETPSDAWHQMADPNYWFAISDGTNVITVDHISNGESLPVIQVADSAYQAVCQAFVSTQNEVFIVKGLAANKETLQSLMETIQTLKVLKYDTKTAIQKNAAPQVSEFGIKEMSGTYYVVADELNVRAGCSTDTALLGSLNYGDQVMVTGSVLKNGADYGWFQIQYGGTNAYVSSTFLSTSRPGGQTASAAPAAPAAAPAGNASKPNNTTDNSRDAIPVDGNDTVTVYAEDGSWMNIFFDSRTNTYTDSHGLVYLPMAGALLYEPVNDTYWNIDPDFWKTHDADDFDYDEFAQNINDAGSSDDGAIDYSCTVYNEAGDWKTIFHYANKGDEWEDRHGVILLPMAGSMYYEPDTDTYWCGNPEYWASHSADDLDYDRFIDNISDEDDIIDDTDDDDDIIDDTDDDDIIDDTNDDDDVIDDYYDDDDIIDDYDDYDDYDDDIIDDYDDGDIIP